MNPYKKEKIVEFIKGKGALPVDQYGQYLNLDDMIVWYGLEDKLNDIERKHIKRELKKMIEGDLFMIRLESGY